MHTLILVRHAEAAPERAGGNDRARTLTERGRLDADRLGARLEALSAPSAAGSDLGPTDMGPAGSGSADTDPSGETGPGAFRLGAACLSGAHLWHSTAIRTTETARLLAPHLPLLDAVLPVEALYDLDLYGVLELVRETPENVKTLILVGHNPAMAETCRHLGSDSSDEPVFRRLLQGFPPATAAIFTVASDWAGLSPNTAMLGDILHP